MADQFQHLMKFLVDNWIKPHYPNEADKMTAIEEYKRCKRISEDNYIRWKRYEDLKI